MSCLQTAIISDRSRRPHTSKQLPLELVISVDVRQTFWQRVGNNGDLVIHLRWTEMYPTEVVASDVQMPMDWRVQIMEAAERLRVALVMSATRG